MDKAAYTLLIIFSIIFTFWVGAKFKTNRNYSLKTKEVLEKIRIKIPEDQIEKVGKYTGVYTSIFWIIWTLALLYGALMIWQLGIIIFASGIGFYFISKPKIKINELEINLKDLDNENLKKHLENENLREDFQKSLTSIQSIEAHRRFLYKSLKESSNSIVILSGWATDYVVDKQFKKLVKNCLNRGVNIFIGFGYKRSNEDYLEKDYEIQAKKNLSELENWSAEKKTKGMIHIREFKNHSKILICDNRFAICGSFNWLSNRHSLNKEQSWVTNNKKFINDELDEILSFFEDYKEEHSRREFFRKFNSNLYPKS